MSLQMQKLVSKETTLTSPFWFLNGTFVSSEQDVPEKPCVNPYMHAASLFCCTGNSSYLQMLLTVVDTVKGAFEERSPPGWLQGVADVAAHCASVLDDSKVQMSESELPSFRDNGAVVTFSSDALGDNENYIVFVLKGAALLWGI